MKTYLVLIPRGPGQRLATTLDGKYDIYEMSDELVVEVKRRAVMPSITDWQNCIDKEDAFDVALGG